MIPKEIMKLYEKLAFSRGYEEAFRDFLDVCLYYLSVGMLAEDYQSLQKHNQSYHSDIQPYADLHKSGHLKQFLFG